MKSFLALVVALLSCISMAFAAVNLNTASVDELDAVKGIGPSKAKATVSSGRSLATLFSPNPLTPFKSSTDLNGPFFVR